MGAIDWLVLVGGSLVGFKLAAESTLGLRECKGDFENIFRILESSVFEIAR